MEPMKEKMVNLPCKDCGQPLPVNSVYLPYLNGKSSCVPHRCPLGSGSFATVKK